MGKEIHPLPKTRNHHFYTTVDLVVNCDGAIWLDDFV